MWCVVRPTASVLPTRRRPLARPARPPARRRRTWTERLYLESDAGAGFDRAHCEAAGFRFAFGGPASGGGAQQAPAPRGVRLLGMGPKLLLSDATTASQPVLRWQLRVKGNTAVEFGVVPAGLEVRRRLAAVPSLAWLCSLQPASHLAMPALWHCCPSVLLPSAPAQVSWPPLLRLTPASHT